MNSGPGNIANVHTVNAGAVDAGLETLRRATVEAHAAGRPRLEARALLALGIALVHGCRGRDGEGATALHAALGLAEESRDLDIVTEACRELGYVEFLRARYERAEAWIGRAIAEAPDDLERAAAQGLLGAVLSDRGRTAAAVDILNEAAEIGQRAQRPRIEGWARSFLGRAHLLRGEPDLARRELSRSMEVCRLAGWMSFRPWPMALGGDVALAEGRVDEASEAFESAFAIGCQLGDPCWEGMGARGVGLVRIAKGELDEGFAWLLDARARCVRIPDAYLWIEACCLDALAVMGVRYDHAGARRWVGDLESLASRTGMREMLVRAYLHRAALGDGRAAEAVMAFRDAVDNSALPLPVGMGMVIRSK